MVPGAKEAVVIHYASPYYDPVKAHEYYMRTRELKGRRSATQLNDEGKKVWSYTKNSIKDNKSSEVDEEKNKRDKKISEFRAIAAQAKKQITENLKALNEQLTKHNTEQKESVDAGKNSEIEKLMAVKIPTGLSKEERTQLVAERKEKIAKIRSTASGTKQSLNSGLKQDKSVASLDAQSRRAQVSTELKTVVEAARQAYTTAMANLDSSYENIYQQEFDKILSEYKKVSPKKKSSSTTSKSHPLSYYIRK